MFCLDGFIAEGQVRLIGARLDANLALTDSKLSNQGAIVLDLDQATMGNCNAARIICSGQVSCVSTRFSSGLDLAGAQLDSCDDRPALNADGVAVEGLVVLSGLRARGEVNFRTSHMRERVLLLPLTPTYVVSGDLTGHSEGVSAGSLIHFCRSAAVRPEVRWRSARRGGRARMAVSSRRWARFRWSSVNSVRAAGVGGGGGAGEGQHGGEADLAGADGGGSGAGGEPRDHVVREQQHPASWRASSGERPRRTRPSADGPLQVKERDFYQPSFLVQGRGLTRGVKARVQERGEQPDLRGFHTAAAGAGQHGEADRAARSCPAGTGGRGLRRSCGGGSACRRSRAAGPVRSVFQHVKGLEGDGLRAVLHPPRRVRAGAGEPDEAVHGEEAAVGEVAAVPGRTRPAARGPGHSPRPGNGR